MKRYYLTEWRQGHITTLKVDKKDIVSTTNWDDSVYLDLPDSQNSDIIACQWRDNVIEAICNASIPFSAQINNLRTPITTNGFISYGKPFDAQH